MIVADAGTVVTGTSALVLHVGDTVLAVLAVLFSVGLVVVWAMIATRTARGYLFLPPTPAPA